MTLVEQTVIIENKLGLHARAATKLAKLSQNYQAKITLTVEQKSATADSIMGLMLLTGSQGKEVNIVAEGDEAKQAMQAICTLFSNKFDEGE
ncbi:HPr family phosphocarrier protein [Thalassomonas sp. M1454]|uniref:HPr family phosphocarrier protein n=1 Tax=Thalassomonas sp. M1454 TaxID=2594477 RepID=UPI00117CB911|nr:HPr family phosphocarrier protein [Thalassomonas sp. M1454]TRX52787.1 HPr family phosphocarrier protein [Thalassomonas sp. M1454]